MSLRTLIVVDEAVARQGLRRMLNLHGALVRTL